MNNIKSYLIHILYRLFLSLQKIQDLNLNLDLDLHNKNNLIKTFCINVEPYIINLFYSLFSNDIINKIKIYIKIQKWLKLTESSHDLLDVDSFVIQEDYSEYFLTNSIDNLIKDANNLQVEIDSYIYKFNYSESLLPNLIILMDKICCLLDNYDSCSNTSEKIHNELLQLL